MPPATKRKSSPARRLGRPPASSSVETRQRIVEVARERFATFGYATTSNKDIAEAAGITTGAIYHYFESKRDLYVAVFDEVEAHVFERFNAVIDGVEGGFLEKLRLVLNEAVTINQKDPYLTAFFVAVAVEAQRNDDLQGLDRRQGIDAARFFGDLVRDGYANGEIAADVEPVHVINAIIAITSGLARFSALVQDTQVHADTTDVLMRMIGGQLFEAPKRRRGRR